eukprot:gene32637-41971_t
MPAGPAPHRAGARKNRVQVPGRRQAARVRLALPAKVILVTGHQPCQLDDLSQTGAKIT